MRRVYKNLCPATISASIMAANMWKNSLKNVESDNNKILYETLLDFFYSETVLTVWINLVHLSYIYCYLFAAQYDNEGEIGCLKIQLLAADKSFIICGIQYVKCKCKSVTSQSWSGPEVSRKLSFPGFMRTAQDGGKVVSLTHRPPLHHGNVPCTHFY